MPERKKPGADPAFGGEQGGEGDARHGGGQRQRHVDQRIRQAPTGKPVADHDPGDKQPERHVDRRRERRRAEAQPQRGQHARFRHRVPHAGHAQFPRPQRQRHQRQQHDHRDPGQGDRQRRREAGQRGARAGFIDPACRCGRTSRPRRNRCPARCPSRRNRGSSPGSSPGSVPRSEPPPSGHAAGNSCARRCPAPAAYRGIPDRPVPGRGCRACRRRCPPPPPGVPPGCSPTG